MQITPTNWLCLTIENLLITPLICNIWMVLYPLSNPQKLFWCKPAPHHYSILPWFDNFFRSNAIFYSRSSHHRPSFRIYSNPKLGQFLYLVMKQSSILYSLVTSKIGSSMSILPFSMFLFHKKKVGR